MNLKNMMAVSGVMSALVMFAATPVVSDVDMTQADNSRSVTISYRLTGAPAVVTLDVETNGPNGWVSIGGEHIQRVSGDVWKKVSGKETYSMVWRPDLDWPDHVVPEGGARAKVTAWALDNTPKYMVVDITEGAPVNPEKVRYYPEEEFLPGGLLKNPDYRTTSIVMRRIPAAGVEWTMGSVDETGRREINEMSHKARLDDDYYMGVFEITQKQWLLVTGYNKSHFSRGNGLNDMRPAEYICYNEIRLVCGKDVSSNQLYVEDSTANYPAAPHPDSFLGKLRDRTGLAFDLPSEAQWEFSARAGNGEWHWGDGSLYTGEYSCTNHPGRYQRNGGTISPGWAEPPPDCDETMGTAFVGTYKQNNWGLFDCHGNVGEICLDYFKDDITADNGAVCTTPSDLIVTRGGGYSHRSKECRSAQRNSYNAYGRFPNVGLRIFCPMGE